MITGGQLYITIYSNVSNRPDPLSCSYPYFSADSWINEGNFGAAHNYNYLHHEPGAYAHNRFYAKRLIFDSIDWVDNYVLDGSITIDKATYPEAAHWLDSDATTGVTNRP